MGPTSSCRKPWSALGDLVQLPVGRGVTVFRHNEPKATRCSFVRGPGDTITVHIGNHLESDCDRSKGALRGACSKCFSELYWNSNISMAWWLPCLVTLDCQDKRTGMPNDTKIRVEAAVISLKRFTVAELCEYTGLRQTQVGPVFADLNKQGYIIKAEVGEQKAGSVAHRPPRQYQVSSDKAKLQSLADRVYRLRRALGSREDSEDGDMRAIQAGVDGVELLLHICDSATAWRPLTREQLQKVERELHAVYVQLENATYKRALDLRQPENRGHPIVATWNRWKTCKELLNRIADRWEGWTGLSRLAAIISPQAGSIDKLQVVTDPRFIDSALFLWIFRQQPFRAAGLEIECLLVEKEWTKVPGFVAAESNAIGFYNRRREPIGADETVDYWADLCVYRGYALLSHPCLGLEARPCTLQDTEKFLKAFLYHCKQHRVQPTIISIGGDTVWRFGEKLTLNVGRESFQQKNIQDANKALAEFRRQEYSLFVGGLPQRLQAQAEGAIPIIDAGHKPGLYAVNGIICHPNLAVGGRAILQSAASLWFDTVSRLKRDEQFRNEVVAGILDMLRAIEPASEVLFQDFMFERVFSSNEFELFAESPAEITAMFAELQGDLIRADLPIMSRDDKQRVFDLLWESEEALGEERMGALGHQRESRPTYHSTYY